MKASRLLMLLTVPLAIGFAVGINTQSEALSMNRGNLIVFSASWCASCREILPVVQDIAAQNNLGVTQIDVDKPDAPKTAHNQGLSIPTDEPPQVYLITHGHATQIYNGKGYKFGYADQARATILQNLQKFLQ